MQPEPTPFTGTADRRTATRVGASEPMHVRIENPTFEGRAENVTSAGVFFFSPERLRVEVEFEQDGKTLVRSGHLVRVQRMSEETTGYAIEFERS